MKYNPYTDNLNVQVFDIETMGLNPNHDIVINSGFCNCDGDGFYQTFLDDPKSEVIMLKEILDRLSDCDAVITYNGNRFDLPFILTRARKYGLADHLPLFWSIDLYKWLRKYWPMSKQLEHLNQKSVEYALGLTENRDDQIGGGECIQLYVRYLSTGDINAKDQILLHNGDDIRQLAGITEKLSFLPYHQIAFDEGFLIKSPYYKAVSTGSILKGNKITASAKTVRGLLPASFFEEDFKYEYDSLTGNINLEIYTESRENKVFIDLNSFPVDKTVFTDTYSDFLLIKDGDEINYKGCNLLVSEIIKKLI